MKSNNAEIFNHDGQADIYDKNVLNEVNPIRAGYEKTLCLIIKTSKITERSKVLELGSGTGNLTSKIDSCRSLTCIDLSEKMNEKSNIKCSHLSYKNFIKSDFIEFFETNNDKFDVIISSYSLHHLTSEEKIKILEYSSKFLNENGKMVIGDLMIDNHYELNNLKKKYKEDESTYSSLEGEFYWFKDETTKNIEEFYKNYRIVKISEMSSVIVAEK
ncbi:MAG TPA: class I SAM-dependent methyltransferase [Victivallales bacterium]|nr:class I SAM-dependent methyltransferase [Victivallales bacterium]